MRLYFIVTIQTIEGMVEERLDTRAASRDPDLHRQQKAPNLKFGLET